MIPPTLEKNPALRVAAKITLGVILTVMAIVSGVVMLILMEQLT